VDEDVAMEVVRALRQAGHEVQLVFEVLGSRTPDEQVWARAVGTQQIVLSCNRDDFLRLAGAAPKTGLIILKRRRSRQAECRHLLDLLRRAGESGLRRNINFA
jgi:hypothetical protein